MVNPIVNFISQNFQKQSAYINNFTLELIKLFLTFIQQKPTKKNIKISSESVMLKHANDFLSQLSFEIPKFFYINLSLFLPLFDNESYTLRNSIINIIFNILQGQKNKDEDEIN